ncbi:MAG: peptide-methionine (S)-S-oxide reductase MsrA [Porticoccaceae bacterium]|nr:peptide-methionine (S)-S-oxide reductase MsrA [Porticoccaceae bacterium]
MTNEVCTLGGGCFWCLDSAFRKVKGILSVTSGYAGGNLTNPTYEQVCSGETGHAEVVQLAFNRDEISFATVLELFFALHDPTTLNRQGADVGSQYRSIIFYGSDTQKTIAEATIAKLDREKIWPNPIVTQVVPLTTFYEAEFYHQNYYELNGSNRYCQLVINPKLGKFRDHYAQYLT